MSWDEDDMRPKKLVIHRRTFEKSIMDTYEKSQRDSTIASDFNQR